MESITISYKALRGWAFAFLLLPVVVFLLFFVRPIISIPVVMLLIAVYLLSIREEIRNNQIFEISGFRLFLFIIICVVWCFLGGQGGLFYQTSDWNERNAIFRDLITNSWPVYYPVTNTALTYYIGHWLPAAFFGRLIYLGSNNAELAFSVGNIALGLWTLIGVVVTLLLVICSVRPKTSIGQLFVLILFIGFSGMDILGCLIQKWTLSDIFRILHLEWWIEGYQFSSNTTCLFWVFNQAVTAWIATLCFYNESNNRNYAFIIGCSLLSSSLPCVGLAIMMIGKVICDVVKKARRGLGDYIKQTLSFGNIVTTGFWVPIVGLYLLSNSAMKNTTSDASEKAINQLTPHMSVYVLLIIIMTVVALGIQLYLIVKRRTKSPFFLCCAMLLGEMAVLLCAFPDTGRGYFVFLLLECGVYWLLIANDFYMDPLFYIIGFVLLSVPCIKVGIGSDFCMRASIPALCILMVLCGQKLCAYFESGRDSKKKTLWARISCTLLSICLAIGLATPIMEVYRGISITAEQGMFVLPADSIYTLNQYHSSGGVYGNFVSENYESSLFYQYFANRS